MAERRRLSPDQYDLFDGFFFGGSPAPAATTKPTPQLMTTVFVPPSKNLSEQQTRDVQAFNSMIAQLDAKQLKKLGEVPAIKRNELFSDYKRMGEQGLSRITKELDKLS